MPSTFAALVESRKAWIAEVLEPWCREAPVSELRQTALEWLDIAGKADVDATLWLWAWSRFPGLVYEGLAGINETARVCVTLTDGTVHEGYPDSRRGKQWEFCLIMDNGRESEMLSLDAIADVVRLEE